MLFDAAVMCGGKNQLLARFECSPLLHPCLRGSALAAVGQGVSCPGHGLYVWHLHLAAISCQTTGMFQPSDTAPSFFQRGCW